MRKVLGFIIVCLLLSNPVFAAIYRWNVKDGSWTLPSSWLPARNAPTTNDILVFDGNFVSNPTCSNISIETVAAIIVFNSCTTVFSTSDTAALTLTGGGGALQIKRDCMLKFTGLNDIAITLLTLSTGTVDGDIVFAPDSHLTRFLLTTEDSAGIIFTNGASFQNAPPQFTNFGNPFGNTGTPDVVIFKSGATYYHAGGRKFPSGNANNPFGLEPPQSKVVFEPGSLFYVWDNNIDMFTSYNGRTFGDITFDFRGTSLRYIEVTTLMTVAGTMSFKSTQSEPLNFTGTGGISIGKDLLIEPGAAGLIDGSILSSPTDFEIKGNLIALGNFMTSSDANRVYLFDGTNTQTITLNSTYTVMPNVTINNPAGIILGSSLSVSSALTITAGNINPGFNNLILGNGPDNPGILSRSTGTVLGSLTQWISTTKQAYEFPVGTAAHFNEATVSFTTDPVTGGTLQVSFIPSNPGENGLPLTDTDFRILSHIATEGYWKISVGNGLSGGTYDLTLRTDGLNLFSGIIGRIVTRANSSSPWTITGNPGTSVNQTVVRTGLSGSADFGIAGTDATYVPYFELFN